MEDKIMQSFKKAAISIKFMGADKKTLRAFKRAAKSIPAYKKILAERGIYPEKIKTIENFREKVPILYKEDLFKKYFLKDLCMPKSVDSLATAIVSSGTSGAFAYKAITRRELDSEKRMVDKAFNVFFNAYKIKTCIINVLPMGVSFVSSYPVISTSVRSDISWHVIKSFSSNFEQIIILGDPNFIKKFIEEGRKTNFEGIVEKLKFIIGGDWSSTSYFQYIKKALSANNENNLFGTFGITEIGLNVGMADSSLFKIREAIQNSKKLQKEIFGLEVTTTPALFFFDPSRTYIEKTNKDLPFSELAFTTISDPSMPFIRYASGDYGTILDTKLVNKTLQENGLSDLIPALPVPILAMTGRISNRVVVEENILTAEDVKQMLYNNYEVAQNITGDFRVYPLESSFKIDIQLMEGAGSSNIEGFVKKSAEMLGKPVSIQIYEYEKFPYNMVLDYESKWAYTKTIKNNKAK